MTCFTPIEGYVLSTKKTDNGKKTIVFKTSEIGKNAYIKTSLPCRRCIGCRIDKSREWAIRCVHEAQMHDKNCFLTLTYNEESINNFGSLDKRDFVLFMKKLRRRYGDRQIRYFQCGEYGDELSRPHHHVCLFGHDWPCIDTIKGENHKYNIDKFKECVGRRNGTRIYRCKEADEIWGKGDVEIGEINFKSAAYAARYVIKKISGNTQEESYTKENDYGEEVEVIPPYATMSVRPGIGRSWIDKYKGDVFPKDYITLDGKRIKTPTYYEKVLQDHEKESIEYERRLKAVAKKEEKTLRRLRTKQKLKSKSVKRLERKFHVK